MNERIYTFDARTRVWKTSAHRSIAYSDGVDVERRLLAVLQQTADLSSTSGELRQHIIDWPSEYHFSPLRHALLRPLSISPTDKFLELGCGCGAITRYLGETGATVVAVEGSQQRAEIAAERCRDLPNVSIYCDDLAKFTTTQQFDFVSLIGVLEYAPQFIASSDPIGNCLGVVRRFLSSNGQLVLAIENQLGLKYFNGCREDHLAQRYYGVHDLYVGRQAITFGKTELAARLSNAGFVQQQFFYPFPDYKLPTLILSHQATLDPDLQIADLLGHSQSRDYGGPMRRNFDERLAYAALGRNGLLADTANSFLILAAAVTQTKIEQHNRGWLASTYSLSRQATYASETRFTRTDKGISVFKTRLLPESKSTDADEFFIHDPVIASPYIRGNRYLTGLQRLLARGGSLAELAEWARPWVDRLQAQSTLVRTGELLPETWLDAIPANFIVAEDGKLELIDTEWRAAQPVPLTWILIRGLVNSVTNCPHSLNLATMTFRQLIDSTLGLLNYPVPDEDAYRHAAELEDRLALLVYGATRGVPHMTELLASPVFSYCSAPTMEDEIRALESAIAATHASRSWRLTAPLRYAQRWLSQLTGG